jgi:hypothetical protein
MKNALLASFLVPLLTMPAFAASSAASDKPMVVAEDVGVNVGGVGVGVGVGDRHRHRDHAVVLNREHHHHHDDHDSDNR